MGRREESVCGVLVTYRPDMPALREVLDASRPQLDALVVVDNSGTELALAHDRAGVTVLPQGRNIGLAGAQNAGIGWARERGHTHVLVLDQDSLPGPGMVDELLHAWRRLSADRRVAAVGPQFRDERDANDAPFVRIAFPKSRRLQCDGGCDEIECDFLISSGSLIPLVVLDDVGDMDGGLFIDNVDLDWSFRARARGYRLYGVCGARMGHRLGDERRVLFGGRYEQVVHSPVRLYFIMRNRLLLYRRPHTPRAWIAQDVLRVPAKFAIFALLVAPRRTNLRYMIRGLLDGAAGRTGGCPVRSEV